MDYNEALEWIKGERSLTDFMQQYAMDMGECQVRIAQADAAMIQQAYWVLRAHKEELVKGGE